MIPFRPRLMAEHRARWPLAVAPLFRVIDVIAGGARPGQSEAHVFDWPDGMRWIISREQDKEGGEIVLHLSASAISGTPIYDQLFDGELPRAAFCEMVAERFKDMTGRACPAFLGFSEGKGVPHWVGPYEQGSEQ